MPLIPEDVIDDVQTRVDIVEVIGRSIPLKRAGRHWKGLCPFHKEKTPSFMVNPEKQIFHCFGCGIGGNVFSFLMQYERVTFPEAVRQIAEAAGVQIPARTGASDNGQSRMLFDLMEKVCRYYERRLEHPHAGRLARAYLRQRGVNDTARAVFRLGLSPAGWDGLVQAAKKSQLSLTVLEQAGLVIQGQRGHYDRFRSRLMFPILDVRGRLLGFGGRSLEGQEPKYLNSPETTLYSKGRHLFGLAQAKESILKTKTAVIVEGYFDCVILAQMGIAHVVSPLGTALTLEQVQLLKRYAESVILAFDADVAGESATLRGIDLLVEAGLHVHVAQLPSGVDPDELIQRRGREAFQEVLAKSLGIFEFLVHCATRRFPLTSPENKVRAAQIVLPTLARVQNAMLRSEYVRLLAERLGLEEAAVVEELTRTKSREFPQPIRRPTPSPATPGAEQLFAALLLDHPARWHEAREAVSLDDVTDERIRRVVAVFSQTMDEGIAATPARLISRLGDDQTARLVTELIQLAQTIPAKEEAFQESVRRLRLASRKRRLSELRDAIKDAQRHGPETEVRRLLTEYQQLIKPTGGSDNG